MNTESLGVSQQMLEYIVIFGILAVVIGTVFVLFWKQIVIGIMVVLCIAVMANHKPPEAPVPPKQAINPVETTPEIKQEQKAETPEELDDKTYFMEDCLSMTDYSEKKCEDIWHKRERPEVAQDPVIEDAIHKYTRHNLKKRI